IVRNYRKERRYSIEKLAELCDVSGRCISNIERGLSEPKFTTVLKLFKALDINKDIFENVLAEIDVHILS
ncbi:MAG: helix-turn-helix domain-containing protein, partial [Muribaculaceae bacterium]|nr:helix-turn-helix domain-containing protein [Muribaculaceae bacterium]